MLLSLSFPEVCVHSEPERAVVREDAQLVAELEAGELGSSEIGANVHPRQVSKFEKRFAGADVFPRTSLYKK